MGGALGALGGHGGVLAGANKPQGLRARRWLSCGRLPGSLGRPWRHACRPRQAAGASRAKVVELWRLPGRPRRRACRPLQALGSSRAKVAELLLFSQCDPSSYKGMACMPCTTRELHANSVLIQTLATTYTRGYQSKASLTFPEVKMLRLKNSDVFDDPNKCGAYK